MFFGLGGDFGFWELSLRGVSFSWEAELGRFDHFEGYFLDVLGCCGEETLTFDTDETSEPCVAMAVELFGVSKGALDGFLSSFVDFFAIGCEAVFVGGVAGVLPDVAVKFALMVPRAGA